MPLAPAYQQQALALPPGSPAGLQLYALRLLPAAWATPPQAQRQALRAAVDHAASVTLGASAGQLQHRPGQPPRWLQQPGWHGAIAYAWPLALWGVGMGRVWGVDVEVIPAPDGDTQHYQDVAALYLAPAAQARIHSSADFADQWCALEAQLKCAGLPLTEAASRPPGWDTALRTAPLALPPAWGRYRAALAWMV